MSFVSSAKFSGAPRNDHYGCHKIDLDRDEEMHNVTWVDGRKLAAPTRNGALAKMFGQANGPKR